MSNPANQLSKLRKTAYTIGAINAGGSMGYFLIAWILSLPGMAQQLSPFIPGSPDLTPYMETILIFFGSAGIWALIYSIGVVIFLLTLIKQSEQLIRSGRRKQTKLLRIVPYFLFNLVYGLVTPKSETDSSSSAAKSNAQEVFFMGISSRSNSLKFSSPTIDTLKASAPIEATTYSDEAGKLRVITYDDAVVQVAMIVPASYLSLMSSLTVGIKR